MKTKRVPSPLPEFIHPVFGTKANFEAMLRQIKEDGIKFRKLPKAVQRAKLIKEGILTAEGKLPVYPMNHVPLGPRD